MDLVPVACLSLSDMLFDLSFPLPEVAIKLRDLHDLRKLHKNAKGQYPPISIFGHADPVDGDVYNKSLSGRRARAIYGILTRNVDMWEQLYREEWHARNVLQIIRKAIGQPSGGSPRELMEFYMAKHFAFELKPNDFLGRGADPKGKGDFHGCAEFNPLVVLSTKENQTLPHEKRNRENQPNRRVLVYLFKPGSKVNFALWPCPTADDPSVAACQARFFCPPKSGDQRRAPGPERREFAKTGDTFACRHYYLISDLSPCERPVKLITIIIRLFDVYHKPMAGAKYKLEVAGRTFEAETDEKGILSHRVPAGATSGKLTLEMWTADLVITEALFAPDNSSGCKVRLENLGYFGRSADRSPGGEAREAAPSNPALMRFQSANDLQLTGKMNDATKQKLTEIYGS